MRDLDFYSSCVIYFCSNVCIGVLLAVAFSDSRARGARLWIAGLAAQLVAVPLFALRGSVSDLLSIIVANGFFTLSWSFFWASFDVFFGKRRPLWLYGLPLLAAALIYTFFLHDARLRVVFGSSLYALQTMVIAGTVLARLGEFRRQTLFMLALGYTMAGLSALVRVLASLVSSGPIPNPFAPGPIQNMALLLSVPSIAACTLGFVLLHRERVECEVRQLADIDYLTGLKNRRGFEALFTCALRRAAVSRSWTSLALIDIDHFKAINDRYGHGVGDKALAELARIIEQERNPNDSVGRIGGDEFCVLFPDAGPERAAIEAERLRRAVAAHDWGRLGLTDPLTVTIGLSSHQGGLDDGGADFMRLADMALLAAKDMARDMVLHADQLAGRSFRADA